MKLFLKNVIFTLVVPASLMLYVPYFMVRDGRPFDGLGMIPGFLVIVLGVGIYLWCVWDFAAFGRGTPAPIDAPKRLVVRGLYRWTRNPMYIGVMTAIGGWILLSHQRGMWIYGCCTAVCLHVFVMLYEEPKLRRLFGAEYDAYCLSVPRWFGFFRKTDPVG